MTKNSYCVMVTSICVDFQLGLVNTNNQGLINLRIVRANSH